MQKIEILTHLSTYASAKIYLGLNVFVDFPTFPTIHVLDKEDFVCGLTNLPDDANISIAIDADNNLEVTDL